MTSDSTDRRRWIALGLLATAQFVVVLDASIVNVALPSIGRALNFSQDSLSWVVNAYVLTFGGFLLLGGRLADLLGRRRGFIAGLIVFAIASLVGGLAPSEAWLIAARALQGLRAPLPSPAAPSLLPHTLPEGAPRNRAAGGVHGDRAALGLTPGAVPHLQVAHPDRCERVRAARRRVPVHDVLLHLAVHAAGARLRPAQGRRVLPPARGHDHHLRGHRVSARHAPGVQARTAQRLRLHRSRVDLVRTGLVERRLRRRHPPPVAARGGGP